MELMPGPNTLVFSIGVNGEPIEVYKASEGLHFIKEGETVAIVYDKTTGAILRDLIVRHEQERTEALKAPQKAPQTRRTTRKA